MITNGIHKSQNEQRKSHPIQDDQQSQQLNIEPPKKQMTMHTDFDIKYQENQRHIIMYIQLDPKNIINLIKQATKNKIYEDQRKFYKDCFFIRKIQTPQTHVKGNFRISFLHYKGLTFTVQFMQNNHNGIQQQNHQANDMFSRMKMHLKTQQNWQAKWFQGKEDDERNKCAFHFQVSPSEVDKILKQKLLLQIIFEKSPSISKDFMGILNQGNTCYANSTLQVLFHFKPLRKLIVELPQRKQNKLTKALQEVFVDLITEKSTARAETLLSCFEKILDEPHRQQDIHQFLISFFDYLESELPQVAYYWTGKDFQTTFSKQRSYQSKQEQNFTQLQLHMADTKGNQHQNISESLRQLLEQDKADQPIDTDHFGKLTVYKKRNFCTMPPLLFMNIKRYEYNPKRRELKKINLDLSYPSKINLDFLMGTPQNLNYVLYAVVVHKGRTPNSGHYFCFINVSEDPDNPDWYEFNDSIVRKAKQSKVLFNFTGKKRQQIYLNQQYGKWAERQEISEQTAYLLTYINRELFAEYQSTQTIVPNWHMQRIQKKLTQEQSRTMTAVKMYVLRTDQEFRPYQLNLELQQAKLKKQETLQSEVKKLQKILSCTVGTIWKVNCKTRTIKHINKNYGQQCRITVGCHTEFKRGIRQPDYFIIVPEQRMADIEDWQHRKLGILHIQEITEKQTTEKVQIASKEDIQSKIQQMKKDGANLDYDKEEFQQFVFGWNDYLHIKKQI